MVIFTFSVLDQKYSFWVNWVQQIKIASLSRNLIPRLNRIRRSQWWCSLFLFQIGNTLFGQIWCCSLFPSFVPKIYLVFWCYLINPRPVYGQRLEVSDLSCFILKYSPLAIIGLFPQDIFFCLIFLTFLHNLWNKAFIYLQPKFRNATLSMF